MPVLLKTRAADLKRNFALAVTLSIAFVVGLILGFIFYGRCCETNVVYVNAVAYYEKVTLGYVNVFSLQITFFLKSFIFVALFLACSLTVYALPAAYCALFIRGVVIGGTGCVLLRVFGIDGLFVFLTVSLVQGLLLSAVLSAEIACNLDLSRRKNLCPPDKKYKLITAAIALALCLATSVYGMLAVGLIVRPIYAVF